ncbi:MAG: response regulator transcription factor [Candidatus Symbiothrix sp.]|jgi:DNA-binding response OmpR family regulator|nr:response regulator transcription factor [Candidatus Symbiothrix sp.]
MESTKLLIVDDEDCICEMLRFNFENEGFLVETAASGEEAMEKILSGIKYDLILLDVVMGGISGFRLTESLRKSGNLTPIIFVTAKNTENDLQTGFSVGGDDYIFKPFSVKEVTARVRAVLKRGQWHQSAIKHNADYIAVGDVKVFLESRLLKIKNEIIPVTKTEFEVLRMLIESPNKIHARSEIIKQVWPNESNVLKRTVDVHIARLRKKMGEYSGCILNRSGYGYSFNEAVAFGKYEK